MPQRLTPQEKKRTSLQRDRRNCYGENDKSSRKAIRRRKAMVNRGFRRAARQALWESTADADALGALVARLRRGGWKKAPDQPLRNHLQGRLIANITRRLSVAPEPLDLLDTLEGHVLGSGLPRLCAMDAMRQLRGFVRARWSLSYVLGGRSTALAIDYDAAATIAIILNRMAAP